MRPIPFPEVNYVIAKDQPEYRQLPAFINENSKKGEVITCWSLSLRERELKFYSLESCG